MIQYLELIDFYWKIINAFRYFLGYLKNSATGSQWESE